MNYDESSKSHCFESTSSTFAITKSTLFRLENSQRGSPQLGLLWSQRRAWDVPGNTPTLRYGLAEIGAANEIRMLILLDSPRRSMSPTEHRVADRRPNTVAPGRGKVWHVYSHKSSMENPRCLKPDYKHVLTSSCRSEPKTKHRPLLAGIKPQSIPNVVVFPDTKLLMCCAWLLPNMLIAPSNAPLVSARNLPTSVPHLCYTQTSINFVLYKFWWLPAPLWPSNAKISPWYITLKTPSNLVKGSDSDMSDTFWYAIKFTKKELSAALNPSCPLHASGRIASRASKFPRSGHSATSATLGECRKVHWSMLGFPTSLLLPHQCLVPPMQWPAMKCRRFPIRI